MSCPDIVELEQFILHDQADPALAAIEAHLSTCAACKAQCAELAENLQLLASLRRQKQSAPALDARSGSELEVVGPYRILRKLGQGGMGTVYEAEQENPRRVVALKMIRPGLVSASLLARFKHESQVLGRLRHPGIAQIYDAGAHEAHPYFAMELVRGQTLLGFAEAKRLPLRGRLELMARICDAVQHAHQRGVIHRDLKPDNILVDDTGDEPLPKILDFGVSRVIDPDGETTTLHTSIGQIIGTVAYMSPEQASANPSEMDTRSDVYALGVICFQLLSGHLPHKLNRSNVAESVRAIVQDEPTQLSVFDRTLRGDVTTIVAKAMEKEKSRRYQTATEMAADIRRFMRDEPISAHPPSTIYGLKKFARRNRGLVAGIAAAFIVLILGVVGTSIGLVRAQRAKLLAIASAEHARSESAKQAAVNAFLQDMLSAANPRRLSAEERARGRGVTVLEALNEAAKKVEAGSLKDQPEVEAAVRATLGATYQELGEFNVAEKHLKVAPDLARRVHGPNDFNVADYLNTLGLLHQQKGQLAEADIEMRQSLEISRSLLGDENADVMTCTSNLAMLFLAEGKFDEAERLQRQVLATRRKLFGDDSRDVAASLNNLALVLDEQGRRAESEPMYRQALAIRRKLLGDEHPDVTTSMNNLAFVLRDEGKLSDAEPLFRQTLEMRLRLFGAEHPTIALAMNNLASLLQAEKKYAEAEPLYRQALQMQRKLIGTEHPSVAMTLNNLASLLRDQGNLVEAESAFREALAMRRKTLGDEHPSVALGLQNLGAVLLIERKLEEAEQLCGQAVTLQSKARGESHTMTAIARMQHGACLAALQQYAPAEQELLAAHHVLGSRLGKGEPHAAETLQLLVKLYNAWDKPEQAAPYAARLAATQPASRQS